jgi:Flp pilus assembly CpaF family ATPase
MVLREDTRNMKGSWEKKTRECWRYCLRKRHDERYIIGGVRRKEKTRTGGENE